MQNTALKKTAADGETALNMIRQSPPDLVLLDLRLPKMSGYDICKTLKADEKLKLIPVILFTASATRAMTAKLLETGADDYLIKPFDDEELLAKIKHFIG